MSWLRITRAENIPLREGRAVRLGGEDIAIFNLGEKFLAVSNTCPHRGGPLADGIVSGDSGGVRRPQEEQACVRTYPVKVVHGIVLVQIAAEEAEAA
jgi:nitrite reductase [NAD(P)H] small subunit